METAETFNKNDKQVYFNQIKGTIDELNDGEKFCSVTLNVGHENPRQVNVIVKKPQFDKLTQSHKIGDKVTCRFYITSRKKDARWYTMANLLDIFKD